MHEDISGGDNVRSTVRNDVRIADKLNTTVQAFTNDKRNTAPSRIVEYAPKNTFVKEIKQFDSSSKMNLANSVPVKTLDLVSFRDTPVNTDNVTNGRSGDVATSIVDKDRIRSPKPSDIGTAATHDEIKNINEKLAFSKYLKEFDFETIKILQRDHEARENMKEIETQLSMTWIDKQKMEDIEEGKNINDIPTWMEMIWSEPISTSKCEQHESKVKSDLDPPPYDSSDSSSSDLDHKRKKRKDKKKYCKHKKDDLSDPSSSDDSDDSD